MDADDRQFIRELLLRFEKKAAEWDRRSERNHQAYMARFERLDAKSDELLAESRAQRQALLHSLDRLGGGGAAPATYSTVAGGAVRSAAAGPARPARACPP